MSDFAWKVIAAVAVLAIWAVTFIASRRNHG